MYEYVIKTKSGELYHSSLYHHGVLGMKWGVRRYQNPDGSLTPEGKKRYFKGKDNKYHKLHKPHYAPYLIPLDPASAAGALIYNPVAFGINKGLNYRYRKTGLDEEYVKKWLNKRQTQNKEA